MKLLLALMTFMLSFQKAIPLQAQARNMAETRDLEIPRRIVPFEDYHKVIVKFYLKHEFYRQKELEEQGYIPEYKIADEVENWTGIQADNAGGIIISGRDKNGKLCEPYKRIQLAKDGLYKRGIDIYVYKGNPPFPVRVMQLDLDED